MSVAGKGRAQRFDLQIALRYRANGDGRWHLGITENISYSGLLFLGENWAEPNTPVEISLALPKEIAGESAAEVRCRGTITRSERRQSNGHGAILATRISHYRFVRP